MVWQVLPLVPTGAGGSPYDGLSAFAGNPLLIDLDALVAQGWLDPRALQEANYSAEGVDYPHVAEWKERLLRRAHRSFETAASPALREECARFQREQGEWVEDYALFEALRERFDGAPWTEWDRPIRLRESQALGRWRRALSREVAFHGWAQWMWNRQWQELHEYAAERGIHIVGDIPIFVSLNSADVWAHPELFQLDEAGKPTVVSGVPPDYFSETGQRWGNPLYRWDVMAQRGFRWWTERFRRTLELVDIARIDHFRGFEAYWEIPVSSPTAINGEWRSGPGTALFTAVERELGPLPLIAEDLGTITPEVHALRRELALPGMRVLQFAWDGEADNPHLPGNFPPDVVAYTGTHDNDTTLGWWRSSSPEVRSRVRAALGEHAGSIVWQMIKLAFESRARFAIVPLQDVMELGSEARMNTPGVGEGNWGWRFSWEQLAPKMQARLRELGRASGRNPDSRAQSSSFARKGS